MTSFDEHLSDWQTYTATPWSRIRYAVVREALMSHLPSGAGTDGPDGTDGPGMLDVLDVLDVGGADGLDSAPLAALGHRVTVLDPATQLLEGARRAGLHTEVGGLDDLPGRDPVDVVLCHYVLQYRDDLARDLALLAGVLRPGGLLSVVLPNPDHRVLTAFLREGPDAALAELEADTATTLTFGTTVRKISLPEVEAGVQAAGLEVVDVVGGRIVGDLLMDEEVKEDPAFYASWEQLELALSRRDPYRRLGQFFQVLARRPADTGRA